MRKSIKNITKVVIATLSGLLLAVLVAPLAVSLLVSVPAVQNAVVDRVTRTLSERLGTKISIDGVDIRLINRVEVRGFYVEDHCGDTLLWVPRLEAPIEKWGLGAEPLTFGRVKVTGAQLWLRKESLDESMNISRMVDSIDKGGVDDGVPFRMRIAAIDADSLTFGLLRPYRERREGVDFSRFVMRDLHTRVEDFVIAGDTIRMNIKSLSANERSGWRVDDLSAQPLTIARSAVCLDDVEIRSEGSDLRVPSIRLVGERGLWRDFSEYSDSVSMDIVMQRSRVTTGLVGQFAPAVAGWGITLDDVSAYTRGVLGAMAGGVESARTGETSFALDFTSRGLPHMDIAQFDARLTKLDTDGEDIAAIVRAVTGRELPREIAAVLSRQGILSLKGEATGGLSDLTASGDLFSMAGVVDWDARVVGAKVDGRVATSRFDLGRTLAVKDLGVVAGAFDVEATLEKSLSGSVRGEISSLAYRGYAYNDLKVDAAIDNRRVDIGLVARDQNLAAEGTATLDLSSEEARYTVDLDLQKFDLAATRLYTADPVSVVSGHLQAELDGLDPDEVAGTVELHDVAYRSPRGTVSMTGATLTARNDATGKSLALRSELADADMRGDVRDIVDFLRRKPVAAARDSIASIDLRVKDIQHLLSALAPTAAIAPGTTARLMLNPVTGDYSLVAGSEFIEYRGILAADISLTADNSAIHFSGGNLYAGSGHISRFELRGGADTSPQLDMELDGRQWRVIADSVSLADGGVALQNMKLFPLDTPAQRLTLTGGLSSAGDIDAQVRVDSLDAAVLDPLLGGILDQTRGAASGQLTLGGSLRDPRINGHLDVPRFETTVAYTGVRYSVTDARLTVDNSVLTLPRTPVSNRLGGTGDIAMKISLTDLRDIRTAIDIRSDRMLVFDTGSGDSEAFYGRVFATASAAIHSDRMGTRMDISGRTDDGTRIFLPLNAKSDVSWADFVVFTDPRATSATTDGLDRKRLIYERLRAGETGVTRREKPLELNLTANVTPAAELHMLVDPSLGPGITGRGEGVIDLRINPASDQFSMTGDYIISSGRFELSMMDVFNKTFEIAPGSTLRWSGEPAAAELSVDASWRVRTSLLPLMSEGALPVGGRSVPVDCIIRLRESLSDPDITFDIALPSVDIDARQIVANAMNTQELKSMQFLSLLTTGSFATDNSITGQAANAGVMATGAVGFDILTNQLNNFLSSEDYNVYFRYRPQDNFASTQVEAGFSTRLWDDRLQLEIEGNWVDNRAATTVGTSSEAANLAGDVSLTWVIDRAGNLRLKVFSQTIDRLNETQGLQESGLGIYYKKDFDSFGDIFRRKNPNFVADSISKRKPGRKKK